MGGNTTKVAHVLDILAVILWVEEEATNSGHVVSVTAEILEVEEHLHDIAEGNLWTYKRREK